MQIYGPNHVHGAQPLNGPHASRPMREVRSPQTPAIQDELILSETSQWVAEARNLPEIRWDRVNQIKAEIAAGTYETPEKWQIALRRLLDEIA